MFGKKNRETNTCGRNEVVYSPEWENNTSKLNRRKKLTAIVAVIAIVADLFALTFIASKANVLFPIIGNVTSKQTMQDMEIKENEKHSYDTKKSNQICYVNAISSYNLKKTDFYVSLNQEKSKLNDEAKNLDVEVEIVYSPITMPWQNKYKDSVKTIYKGKLGNLELSEKYSIPTKCLADVNVRFCFAKDKISVLRKNGNQIFANVIITDRGSKVDVKSNISTKCDFTFTLATVIAIASIIIFAAIIRKILCASSYLELTTATQRVYNFFIVQGMTILGAFAAIAAVTVFLAILIGGAIIICGGIVFLCLFCR